MLGEYAMKELRSAHISRFRTNRDGLDIELHDLATINYFVGKNGQGKSRLLRALVNKLMPGQDQAQNSLCSIEPESISCHFNIMGNYAGEPTIDKSTYVQGLSVTGEMNQFVRKALEATKQESKYKVDNVLQFTTVIERPDGTIQKREPVHKAVAFFGKKELAEGESVTFSNGTLRLANIIADLENAPLMSMNDPRSSLVGAFFDDIDNSLHPDLQRQLHGMIELGLEDSKIAGKAIILASTHSPFVIAGAARATHSTKVYLVDSGQTVDIFGKHGTDESKRGYTGEEILLASHQLLGSQFNDFIPAKMLYTESSLIELLFELSTRLKLPRRYFPTPSGGDSFGIQRAEINAKVLQGVESFLSGQYLSTHFSFEILAIFDGPLSSKDNKKVDALKKCRQRIDFDVLPKISQLEDCYPLNEVNSFLSGKNIAPWDGKISFNKHLLDNGVSKDSKGKLKCELAQNVARGISTPDEMKRKLPTIFDLVLRKRLFGDLHLSDHNYEFVV